MKSYIIVKDKRIDGDMTVYYYQNDGKLSLIRGVRKSDFWSVRSLKQVLLSLRASNYLFSVHCNEKNPISTYPIVLLKQKLSDGYTLGQLMYDTEAKEYFDRKHHIDLTFELQKGHNTEHYIYRIIDYSVYNDALPYFLEHAKDLKIDMRDNNRFPDSTIVILRALSLNC